jgi:hypothetical protein
MPQCREANRNVQLSQTALLEFGQRQIRSGLDPALQPAIVGGQAGTAITANLPWQALAGPAMVVPKSFDTFAADTKPFANLAGAFATFPGRNDSLPQILA